MTQMLLPRNTDSLFGDASLLPGRARPSSGLIPIRLTVLNYWLFHHEVFHFAQGRLFLTGHNGSGKSTAMTAAITLLLDGNSSPARLDAFGSRQRSLAYYLLGSEQSGFNFPARRSYLALEFVNPEGEIQSIGLGLQLTRGGDLKKWGFWLPAALGGPGNLSLLDHDVPLTERQLRERVTGLGGEAVSGETDHADLVRRRIFGAAISPDEYRDTLNMILKLRSSKLGGDVRLAEVQKLLRDSLRPVAADDRAALNAGIDKIDTHLEVIASLERQHDAAHTIADTHLKATLARVYQARATEAEAALAHQSSRARQTRLNTDLSATQEQVTLSQTSKDAALAEVQVRGAERASLELVMSVPLEAQSRLETALHAEQRQISRLTDTLKKQRSDLTRTLSQQARDTEARDVDTGRLALLQTSLQQRVWWTGQDALTLRHAQVAHATTVFTRYAQTTMLLSNQQARLLAAQERQGQARATHEQERERLEAELIRSAAELTAAAAELDGPGEHLTRPLLATYQEHLSVTLSAAESFTVVEEAVITLEHLARDHEARARDHHKAAEHALQHVQRRLTDLHAQVEAEPAVPPDRVATLALLQANGITAAPLYALVRPRQNADPAALASTESALSAAGLLTALQVDPAQHARALDLLRTHGLTDALLATGNPDTTEASGTLTDLLEPEPHAPPGTDAILHGLHVQVSGAGTWIGPDGRWHNGMLDGHAQSASTPGARFLGREARLRERQARLDTLEQSRAEHQLNADQSRQDLDAARADTARLTARTSLLRAPTRVQAARQAISAKRDQARTRHEETVSTETRERRTLSEVQSEHTAHRERLITAFAPLGLPGDPGEDALQALHDDLDRAKDEHTRSTTLRERLNARQDTLTRLAEDAAHLQKSAASLEQEHTSHREQVAALAADLRTLTKQRNTPDMAAQQARLSALIRQLTTAEKTILRETTELARLHERLAGLNTALHEQQAALLHADQTYARAQTELKDRIATHPRLAPASQEDLEALLAPHGEPDAPDSNLLGRNERDAFEQNRPALETPHSYAPLFTDGPTFLLDGQRVGPDALLEHLGTALQENTALLTEQESEVFSGMLIRNLIQDIHRKVQEAERWTEQVRSTLKRLNFHGETLDLRRVARPQNGLPGEGLAALIDGKMDPGLRGPDWWAAVIAEVRNLISWLRAQTESDTPFAQAFEQALDHRQWTGFHFYARSGTGNMAREQEITDRKFMTRSGGERSAVLYTYLFAAIAARFDTLGPGVPRLIGLDEAFAGMDLDNIASLYGVMTDLDLSWIATSERPVHLSPALPMASAYEFFKASGKNGDSVSRLSYLWDGRVQRKGSEAGL